MNKGIDVLTYKIEQWAIDRGLDEAQPEKQMLKLVEEIGELAEGLAKGNTDKVVDGIGDTFVVLTILTMQLDLDIEDCIRVAYEEIKGREGEMIDGIFVKESDLK